MIELLEAYRPGITKEERAKLDDMPLKRHPKYPHVFNCKFDNVTVEDIIRNYKRICEEYRRVLALPQNPSAEYTKASAGYLEYRRQYGEHLLAIDRIGSIDRWYLSEAADRLDCWSELGIFPKWWESTHHAWKHICGKTLTLKQYNNLMHPWGEYYMDGSVQPGSCCMVDWINVDIYFFVERNIIYGKKKK